jgi:hypothetical protein
MRIRIVEPRNASVDGLDLAVFAAGHLYEVDPTIATYLIVSGVAEPCADGAPALVVQSNEVMVGVCAGARHVFADIADDFEEDAPPPPEPAA